MPIAPATGNGNCLARPGLLPFQARKVAFNLGLSGQAFKQMTKFVTALYNAYVGSDAAMFEINPVLTTPLSKQ